MQPSQGSQSGTFSVFTKKIYLSIERSCEHVGAGRFFPKPILKALLETIHGSFISFLFSLLSLPSSTLLSDPRMLHHIPAFILHHWIFLYIVLSVWKQSLSNVLKLQHSSKVKSQISQETLKMRLGCIVLNYGPWREESKQSIMKVLEKS